MNFEVFVGIKLSE